MKLLSWLAAAAILVANATALIHAARNRSGTPDAEITLTERELRYIHQDADNSGVDLTLTWSGRFQDLAWLDTPKLRTLGFDCSVPASDAQAGRFYGRQLARSVFVALEYDGPASRSLLEDGLKAKPQLGRFLRDSSRLAPIDAASDLQILRGRYPNRNSVLIVPTAIRIRLQAEVPSRGTPVTLGGYIQEIPNMVHIPRPFSEGFRSLPAPLHYRVHLRYGRFLEPWVTGVEFPGN